MTHSSTHDETRTNRARALMKRSVLKRIGIVLIVASVLLLGYAAYQIWGTGIVTSRHQERLAEEFGERVRQAAAGVLPDPVDQPPSTSTARPVSPWDNPVIQAPATQSEPLTTPVPAEPVPTPTTERSPGVLYEAAPTSGQVLGRIIVESLELDWMVIEGVGANELAQGPGHMPHTPVPGQPGNAVISGHRTTYGAPFYHLDKLVPGDTISVETLVGTHAYEVIGSTIVPPTGVWVTEQWEGSWLTLTTCTPLFSSRERLIVFAKLVEGPNEEAIHDDFTPSYGLPEPPEA